MSTSNPQSHKDFTLGTMSLTLDDIKPMQHDWDRLGYWLVMDKYVHCNQNQAWIDVTQRGHGPFIKYVFGGENYANYTWDKTPVEDLQTLYKQRAEQLRDTYDYLVLAWSGGSDSNQMLWSFFNNGIYPDMVVTWSQLWSGRIGGFVDTMCNANKEAVMMQNIIHDLVSGTKVPYRQVDYTINYDKIYYDADWPFRVHQMRAPHANAQGYCAHGEFWDDKVPENANAAVVYGMEKPQLQIDDNNNVYCYNKDSVTANWMDPWMYTYRYRGLAVEQFYDTPDMPAVSAKQSHQMLDYFSDNQDQIDACLKFGPQYDRLLTQQVMKSHLYDYPWKNKEFSIGKGNSDGAMIRGYRDCWLWEQDNDHPVKKNVLAGWEMLKNNIAPEYFVNGNYLKGIIGTITDLRYLGKI